jgi:hypothetical protein
MAQELSSENGPSLGDVVDVAHSHDSMTLHSFVVTSQRMRGQKKLNYLVSLQSPPLPRPISVGTTTSGLGTLAYFKPSLYEVCDN